MKKQGHEQSLELLHHYNLKLLLLKLHLQPELYALLKNTQLKILDLSAADRFLLLLQYLKELMLEIPLLIV